MTTEKLDLAIEAFLAVWDESPKRLDPALVKSVFKEHLQSAISEIGTDADLDLKEFNQTKHWVRNELEQVTYECMVNTVNAWAAALVMDADRLREKYIEG